MLILSGCFSVFQTAQPEPVVISPNPVDPSLTGDPASEIDRLLDEADLALSEHRLTTPPDNNAWYRYLRVLTMDPENQRAVQGIHDIADKYLDWSLQSLNEGNLNKAQRFLTRARAVDDQHPNILAVDNRIREYQKNQLERINLSPAEISQRSPSLAQKLELIGAKIPRKTGQVIIRARSDIEGRWIYQQLSRIDRKLRLRAQILFDNLPSLTIITPK